jgi:GntR family transcriptional regulator / MocR family aminotransferase
VARQLVLNPRSPGNTITRWLYEEIRHAILSGKLRRGSMLPATRELAQTAGVSRHVVVNVYEQMVSEGYLAGEVGRGTFVRNDVPEDFLIPRSKPPALGSGVEELPEGYGFPITPFRLTQPSLDDFPLHIWNRIASQAVRRTSVESLAGGQWVGSRNLRAAIADYLGSSRGVACTPDNIVIVSGTQQSLDLVTRLVMRPGDSVWLEDPCYIGATDAFRMAGARIIAVPVDSDGLNPDKGRALCGNPRAVYVTPAHQFGLGTTLSLDRRFALLALCRQGTVLIEDDYDSEFRFVGRPLPAMKGMAGAESVFLLGTFNKTLFPALRLGYMVVPDTWMEKLLALRYRIDRYPPTLSQEILTRFIDDGHYGRHLRRMRQLYGERRAVLAQEVGRSLGGILQLPSIDAGLSTPAYLLGKMGSARASQLAAGEGVEAWPIDRYVIQRRDLRALMLGFASFNEHQIRKGVRALARALGVRASDFSGVSPASAVR